MPSDVSRDFVRLAAVGNTGVIGGVGASVALWSVVINTGTATSVLTLRNGSATGPIVAVIDCATAGTRNYEGCRISQGLYAEMTVANADVTITYG